MKPSIKASLRFPVDTLRLDGSVDLCHNLRPARGNTCLIPVGAPQRLTSTTLPGSRLLPGGVAAVADADPTLFLVDEEGLICFDGAGRYRPEGAAASPRCAIPTGDGSLLVMTGEGEAPFFLNRDGESGRWSARSAVESVPPLTIERRDEGLLSIQTDELTLRSAYSSRSGSLTEPDAATMREVLCGAYLTIGNRAIARRQFFQPVIVRYRLRGADGSVIYTSAPVLIGPDSGVQLTSASFSLSGSGFASVGRTTLSVRTFTLGLRGRLDGPLAAAVSSVELLVSPQLHPLEENLRAPQTLGSFTATTATLSMRLPGINETAASAASPSTLLHSQVEAILARIDRPGVLEAVGSARFDSRTGGWEGLDSPYYADRRDCRADLKALRAVMASPVSPLSQEASALRALTAPHCLSASVAGVSGDTVVYGGLSSLRFGGHLPAEMAVGRNGQAGQPMAVKVIFSDGSSVTRSMEGDSEGAVSLLSPLLTYPSADAVEMKLYSGSSVMSVALRPDPSGSMAYWLHPSGAPIGFSESVAAFEAPTASPAPRTFPGMIAVAPLGSPLSPQAVVGSAGSTPVAIVASPGSSGGWDAGSSRFCLFGPSGLQSLTVNSARSRLTVRTLDSRPVGSADAVCVAGSLIAAIAGGDLVTVASQRVSTLIPAVGASHLGYVGLTNELWCFPSSERSDRALICSPDGRVRFTRTSPLILSVLSSPPWLWATDADGHLHDLAAESDSEVNIAYRATIIVADRRRVGRSFDLPFRGETGAGRVELRSRPGVSAGPSDLLVAFDVQGCFAHLAPVAVFAPHCHSITLSIELPCRPGRFCIANM